jgi:NhaP-type Na+/H+ or K+/H+ antiporter
VFENPIYYLTGVLVLGIAAQWIAWRLRTPAIVILLAVGFICGVFVRPDAVVQSELLFPVVSLAVAVVLFEGGLSLKLSEVRASGGAVVRLVTVGVLVTWVLASLAAWKVLGFLPSLALVTGALLTVSGPTVILPLLRHVRPSKRIGAVIKWEGIVNDPIGAVLTALMFEFVKAGGFQGDTTLGHALAMLAVTLASGTVIGLATAWGIVQAFKRYLVPDYLQNGVVLAIVIGVFVVCNQMQHEAGLVAVTVLGVALANQRTVAVKQLIEFKENLRVLLISTLFIVLASRVQIEQMKALGWPAALFVVVVILIIRPAAVALATWGSELKREERLLLAWIAPRGIVAAAVSSLFALELLQETGSEVIPLELVEQADQFVAIIFLVIASSVTVYGLTVGPLARWLSLSHQNPEGVLFAGAQPWVLTLAKALHEEGVRVLLVDTNHRRISAARMAGLPASYASILSEFVREELDLAEIGRLLAMTPNDEVNDLSTLQFVEHFGRKEVYQLAPQEATSQRQETVPTHGRGRILFTKGMTHDEIARRIAQGATIKKTQLTDDFGFEEFKLRHGASATPLFLITESGKLRIFSADQPTTPQPGQKVIALVDKQTVDKQPVDKQPADKQPADKQPVEKQPIAAAKAPPDERSAEEATQVEESK